MSSRAGERGRRGPRLPVGVTGARRKLSTFSIAARDPVTGMLGVAVSSKAFSVGSLCPFVAAGVGAVATQAWVNPYLGPAILGLLGGGLGVEGRPRQGSGRRSSARAQAAQRRRRPGA